MTVIETGHGPKYAAKEQKIFAIDPEDWLRANLMSAGFDPASITDVAVTHLHFDHAGAASASAAAPPQSQRSRLRVRASAARA